MKKELAEDDLFALEIALIPQELRDLEAGLMQSRWFDYRDMLPAQATQHFADRYDAIYREVYSALRDYRKADDVVALRHDDLFKSPELLALWRARQAADAIGCKYDFYLRQAFKMAWDRGWTYIPRPNQIYGEALTQDIADQWKLERAASLQLAESPFFRNDAYVGHPNQDAYHQYLVAEIKQREHPHLSLARVMFKERALPVEVAGAHFPVTVLRRARLLSPSNRQS